MKTGVGEAALNENRYLWEEIDPNYVAKDLHKAMDWLFNQPPFLKGEQG